ncbi:MAG: TIM barrel protein [Kiritimatiellae bacterium]|nr:TIM barrel protein [Kiritimatiellia bacterium]
MKLSLSTNWCNRSIEDGAEIAEKALELGFDELELGFRTTHAQVPGFKAMLSKIPVGSIHAFCPVPPGAPDGHPELYRLANFSKADRELAAAHVKANIRFASSISADTVVLHAGRVAFNSLFKAMDSFSLRAEFKKGDNKLEAKGYAKLLAAAWKRRRSQGKKALSIFYKTLEGVIPVLEKENVTLALENLPYLEGFPDEEELAVVLAKFKGAPVKGWFDTGHHRVRHMLGWIKPDFAEYGLGPESFAGMHLNDVEDYNDDHLAPGDGKVDFASLKPYALAAKHIVFEPNAAVEKESIKSGVALIRRLWA